MDIPKGSVGEINSRSEARTSVNGTFPMKLRRRLPNETAIEALRPSVRLTYIREGGRSTAACRSTRTMARKDEAAIIVAGTGPAGLLAALGLAEAGFEVALAGPPPRGDDGRTTALMAPALAFLERVGALEALEASSAPLVAMRIVDATSRLIRSPVVTFRAAEIGLRRFGLNVPNGLLAAELTRLASRHGRIRWTGELVAAWHLGADAVVATLSGRDTVEARLAVAADGRTSQAREAAGIAISSRPLAQAALVLNFAHARDHGFISTEFHTESGPFTQVPLPGRRSSLVWVVRPGEADALADLSDADLSLRVERRMQSMLGRVEVETARQVYPLGATLPSRFAAKRVALVGEAAHVFPPIGAQGLNLGIRDISELIDISSDNAADPGSERALSRYDARRRPDILARTGAVSLLNMSLLSDLVPAQIARSAGLGVLGAFAPLRAFFMREGLQPGSGLAQAFSALREQIRR